MLFTPCSVEEVGLVRAELYDDSGRVFETIESENTVTDVASKIVIDTLAKPGGFNVYEVTETHDTSTLAADDGFYHFTLGQHMYKLASVELTGTGAATYEIPGSGRIEKLREVRVSDVGIEIGTDVWVSDPDGRQITFLNAPAQSEPIKVVYLEIFNMASACQPYSETVKVGVSTYTRSTTRDGAGNLVPTEGTYVIDYDTGDIKFSQALVGVVVTYKYLAYCGVAYMGISDKPADAAVGLPITFTAADSNRLGLDAEYPGTRQLIIFPAQTTFGVSRDDTFTGNGTTYRFTLSSKPIARLDQVLINGNAVVIGTDVTLVDGANGIIEFALPPASGAQIQVKYTCYGPATVTFVADFPPGVPGAMTKEQVDNITTASGVTSYSLSQVPSQVISVTLNGSVLNSGADYAINAGSKTITLTASPPAGGSLVVTYHWVKTYAEIYEVGLFDRQVGGSMFAISGLGPITKDQNVGMRVTWSVTLTMSS